MASHLTGASQATLLATELSPATHLALTKETPIPPTHPTFIQQDSIIDNPPDLPTISPLQAAVLQANADVTRAEATVNEACDRITREVREGHKNNTDASYLSSLIKGHIIDGAHMEKALDKARKRAKKARKRAKKARKLATLAASKPQTGLQATD